MTAPAPVRPPAVAGAFYPADAGRLRAAIEAAFAAGVVPPPGIGPPSALVVPHAGYPYSGPVAASAYARLRPFADQIRRVALLGPGHRVPVRGLALSSASAFETPLGRVPVDAGLQAAALAHPSVTVDDLAHAAEHSLEVQLPFLQVVLDRFDVLPVVVGDADAGEVADVLERLWTDDVLVVVSTDLSHYHRHEDAVVRDRRTCDAVVDLRDHDIGDRDACGSRALRGLIEAVRRRGGHIERIDRRTSGDTAGDRSRVVGYGAFVV